MSGGGGAVLPDRLLVDLGADGQAAVASWPESELPQEVSRAPLAWPLDADALEDLRWYLEDYLLVRTKMHRCGHSPSAPLRSSLLTTWCQSGSVCIVRFGATSAGFRSKR
jgi:hypothetical protein